MKEEEELGAYVGNGYNLDRQVGEGNSFWDRDIAQGNAATWKDEETGQTSGFRERLER